MHFSSTLAGSAALLAAHAIAVTVNISSTESPETDWAAVYYGEVPLLIGNDASPDTGGFHAWPLTDPLGDSLVDVYTRRSSLTLPLYGIGGRDLLLTLSEPDTLFHVFEGLEDQRFDEITGAQKKLLGDWSSLCSWRSTASGEQYFFIFGKEDVVQLLVRNQQDVEIVEVQRFSAPIEAEGCAVSRNGTVYFTSEDDGKVFAFTGQESTTAPKISVAAEIEDITGFTLYAGKEQDFFVIATTDVVTFYSSSFEAVGEIELGGEEDLAIQGLTVFQGSRDNLPSGALAFASESEDNAGFGIASLEEAFGELDFLPNTAYSPRGLSGKRYSQHSRLHRFWLDLLGRDTICDACSNNGFCSRSGPWFLHASTTCDCFAGFEGKTCAQYSCLNDCSGQGQCVGPNTCGCEGSWGGPDCSWLNVEATYETDPVEGDADDAAIWISPVSNDQSRVITTIKSEEGAGLAVFDLEGNQLQHFEAGEPNNVNIIYNFTLGDRVVDLTFAACRADDTLCLAEVTSNGTLRSVDGGDQPTKEDFTVYGSCAYQSKKTGKTYLIVNSKDAEFLQYELTSSDDGALETELARNFTGGTGGQVEGCVTDAENGYIFLGEELYGLWRYDAEPDSDDEGHLVDSVRSGDLDADVEGVTLVEGSDSSLGFILVSSQGTSSFNIYRREPPHEFVYKFTVVESADGQIDGVSNTDGINGIATALGPDFPCGLVVVHDDANELPSGATSSRASFKMLSLADILGAEEVAGLNLLDEVDADNDPRA